MSTPLWKDRPDKPARRGPVSAPVLWIGIALGTFLAVAALTHGVMLPLLPGAVSAIGTFLLLLAVGVVLIELTRRHHRTVARHGWHYGKRGAVAAVKGTGRGTAVAGRHARKHGGRGAVFVAGKAKSRWQQWRAAPDEAPAEPDEKPSLSQEWDVPPDAGLDPARQSRNTTGGTTMTASRITPDRRARRSAARTGGPVPDEWGPVVAQAADFEPESDGHLLEWMARQVTGMSAYAEGLIEAYETGTNTIGIDPKGLAALHDVADAAAHAAATMGGARTKFTEHYELPREFAANGGLMTHNGRWITGEGA